MITNLGLTTTSFDKLNGFIIDKHSDQSDPRHTSVAPMFVGAFNSVVGQLWTTLLGQDISAGALEVVPGPVKCSVMRITTDGAGTSRDRLAGKLKIIRTTDLGKGTGFIVTRQA